MPFFRKQSNSWFLFFIILAIAMVCRFQAAWQQPISSPVSEQRPASKRSQIQKQELEGFVSATVGIQEERGDTIQVIVR